MPYNSQEIFLLHTHIHRKVLQFPSLQTKRDLLIKIHEQQ